jgi:hypothetical protein
MRYLDVKLLVESEELNMEGSGLDVGRCGNASV